MAVVEGSDGYVVGTSRVRGGGSDEAETRLYPTSCTDGCSERMKESFGRFHLDPSIFI